MKPHLALIASILAFTILPLGAAENAAEKGRQLATEIWKASGGENWEKVREIQFTFAVEQEGKALFSAQHVWNVAAGMDEVKWQDKQGKDHQVTADLNVPPSDEEGKTAYSRWVNDSYWLLAPLKLLDRGVQVEAEGLKDRKGVACETLRLKFDKVGLTPTDQYVLYVDPKTKLVVAWDYVPASGAGMQATWEKYETFGGLKLATEHNFNGKTIKLTGIKVVTAK